LILAEATALTTTRGAVDWFTEGGQGAPQRRPGPSPLDGGRPIIECQEVRKLFGGDVVLDSVSCRFPRHATSALVGPSGTGKTTLMRLMLGVIRPDGGQVIVDGRPVHEMDEAVLQSMRLNTGVLLEGPRALFSSMTVFENVAFPLRQHAHITESELRGRVIELLEEVGLADHAHKTPETISMGMRVRAAFARAVALKPSTLICDSPDYGMDPVRATLLYRLIAEKRGDYVKSVILITHDMPSVFDLSDHIVIMNRGRIVEQGSREQIQESENVFTRQFIRGEIAGPLGMD
jgi:phospholipid/cholesterol/gamma-HCH transport system ATP-binding protein